MDKRSFYLLSSLLLTFSLLSLNAANLIHAVSSTIVISEVQTAGVTAGDEFIELRNLTNSDINLGEYRLVRRTSAGATDSSIKAFENTDVIPANGYYLWTGDEWSGTETPDASTSGTLANNNGIALRLGAANTGEVVDSVAWGTSTNAFVEGSVFATNPEAGQSIERVGADTDNNSTNFVINAAPNPQNSQTVPSASPTPTATPSSEPSSTPTAVPSIEPSVEPSPSATATATPTVTSTPTSIPTATPTSTPAATPTPQGQVIARFYGANGKTRECRLEYKTKHFGFFIIQFPKIKCEWI